MKKFILIGIFFACSVFLYSQNGNKKLTFEELYSTGHINQQTGALEFTPEEMALTMKFNSRSIRGVQWIDGGNNFTYLDTDTITKQTNIFKYEIATKKRSLFINSSDLKLDGSDKPFRISNYFYSPNEKYILFTGMLPARRMKSGGSLFLYDISTKNFFEIDTKEATMNVKFSPDASKIGYVKNHNIFIYDLETKKEKQLTFDGNENILNGHFDWVYEEEFGISDGWQFSPDSKEIAFWQLDQTLVPSIEIQQFDSLYFNTIKMKYPKAGGKNSFVKIGSIDLANGKISFMDIGKETDIYIPRIKWTENVNTLSIQRMNRLQTKLEILLANTKNGETKIIYKDEDTTWVEIEGQNLYFTKDGKYFVITSEKDGFNHLYLYKMDGTLVNQITKGNWEVSTYVKVDDSSKVIYFLSEMENPLISNLYKINFDGSKLTAITKGNGNNSINFSHNFTYFIRTFNDVNTPSVISLESKESKLIETLESNKKLLETLNEYSFAFPEFLKFKTTDGVTLNAQIIKPKNFDEKKKYPVLIYNYSGPGSQTVKDSWGGKQYLWHQMLAQDDYIIFMIDNRGTGGRGKDFERIVYKNLGFWEVNDLIEATKYLSGLGYVDYKRIGIWGWSYGGYVSALALLNGADYFKTAIAVAPVTDWDFYDSIYSERFMSTPDLNPIGYEKSSVVKNAIKLKGNLLICHGTADDNVHFQNTAVFVDELIKMNKQFNVMFYPGKDHGIYGGKTREQLFYQITNFIKEKL